MVFRPEETQLEEGVLIFAIRVKHHVTWFDTKHSHSVHCHQDSEGIWTIFKTAHCPSMGSFFFSGGVCLYFTINIGNLNFLVTTE